MANHDMETRDAQLDLLAAENARLRQQVVFVTGDRDAALASMQRAHDERDEMLPVVEAAKAVREMLRTFRYADFDDLIAAVDAYTAQPDQEGPSAGLSATETTEQGEVAQIPILDKDGRTIGTYRVRQTANPAVGGYIDPQELGRLLDEAHTGCVVRGEPLTAADIHTARELIFVEATTSPNGRRS